MGQVEPRKTLQSQVRHALPERRADNQHRTEGRSYAPDRGDEPRGVEASGRSRRSALKWLAIAAAVVGFLTFLAGTQYFGFDVHLMSVSATFLLAVLILLRA